MKKFLSVCFLAAITQTAKAQLTVYQSADSNIPQQSYPNGGTYPFTVYQSVNSNYSRNNIQHGTNRLQETNLKIIRGIYQNQITNNIEYIKIKVADYGKQLFAKAYYNAGTDQWFLCNNQIVALGFYDDAELRKYFNYKVTIHNVGTIYF